MKKQPFLMVMALLCLLPNLIFSQTNDQNLKKYWENRDRLRKFFTKIGPNQGESIIANMKDRAHNAMRWSDATTQLGFYIAILASEYELLRRDNLPTQGTLNELYFAINAIKRLDKKGEVHYAQNLKGDVVPENENGWFLRDDVPNNFNQNWSNHYLYTTHSDFYNTDANSATNYFSPGNEPSQDQMYSLMMGFVFVKKYVGNIYVDPLGNGTGFFLGTEVSNIARRMRNWLLAEKYNRVNEFEGNSTGFFLRQNYTFNNPVYDWEAMGGHDNFVFMLAWPTMQVMEYLTGEAVDNTFHVMYNQSNIDIYDEITYEGLKDHYDDLVDAIPNADYEDYCINIFNKQLCIVGESNLAMTMRFIMMLEAMGAAINGTPWHEDKVATISALRQQPLYPFMADVLAGGGYSADIDEYLKLWLDDMPLCDGCFVYSENDDPNNPLSGNGGPIWSSENYWLNNNLNGSWANVWIIGNQPGLDYMILYNLYHLAFDNQLNLPVYTPEVICPCKSQKFPEVSNSENNAGFDGVTEIILPEDNQPNLQNTRLVRRYNNDYKQYGINLERYLIREVNINGGVLDLREDVKVCGGGITHLNLNGRIKVGNSGTNEPAILRYTAGTLLNIQANGYLEVADNSTVIIERGATLRFHNGGNIILSGPNSVLEIRGKLELMPNAVFQTSGDGYVLFNIQEEPLDVAGHNISANSTNSMIFENATGNPKTLKLVVAQSSYIFPPDDLQLFKVENVRVQTKQEGSIVLGSYFEINNSQIEGPGDGFTITRLNFNPQIRYNTFLELNRALTFMTPNIARTVRIHYNEFLNCSGSIYLYEVAAHIAANKFDHSGGIVAGAPVPNLPIRAGLYRGPLKVELNTFKSSIANEVTGSAYPNVNFTGNVLTYPSMNPSFGGYAYAANKATTTFKCNYFENQPEAIFGASKGHMNLSTSEWSFVPLKTGVQLTGGNNIFKNNKRTLVIFDQENSDPFHTATYNLNLGQNLFETQDTWNGASLYVDRRKNFMSNNFNPDLNGNLVINGNQWLPLLSTINYPNGGPTGVIEKNWVPGYHFDITEFYSPNYIVGVNVAPPSTCPIAAWNAPLTTPNTFNPIAVLEPDFSLKNEIGDKQYIEIPFELDGGVYGPTGTTVGGGVFNGTPYSTAFNNGLNGMTTPVTNSQQEVEHTPTVTGLLNMANLLVNTAHHNTTPEIEIFKVGYERYFNCLSQAAAMNTFEGDVQIENNLINATIGVFNAINNFNLSNQQTEPDRYYDARVNTSIDKCHLYRMFGRYTEAVGVLTEMSGFIQAEEADLVNYLTCYVTNEKQLMNSEISFVDFENNVLACGMQYRTEPVMHGNDTTSGGDTTQTGGGSNPPVEFTMTPNPVTTQITVDIMLNVGGVVKVAVFDSYGIQVVPDINMGTLVIGTHQTNVPLTGLTPGTYTMVVYLDDVPYSQNFVKVE